jgi:hypothetical protein
MIDPIFNQDSFLTVLGHVNDLGLVESHVLLMLFNASSNSVLLKAVPAHSDVYFFCPRRWPTILQRFL